MQVKFLKLFTITALVGGGVFLVSCGGGDNKICLPLFDGKEISSGLLDKYVAATSGQVQEEFNLNEEVHVYVDKSSGINEAFSSPEGGTKAKNLLTEIAGKKAKFFSVLNTIKPENFQGSPTNYYDKKNSYDSKEKAFLEMALNEIIKRNGLSFFVTDGEEFDQIGEEDNNRPWAKEPMVRWIQQGNSIHFWITDFKVKNKNKEDIVKHLYFMAFVPSKMSTEKPFQDLVKSLTGINPDHLELSNTSWQILKPSWAEQSTGLDSNLLKEGVFEKNNYFRNFENAFGSYEFMSVQLPIKAEVLTVEGALTQPQFYRDLFVDLSNNKFFDISKIDVEVTEISNDLNSYAKFDEIASNIPNTTKETTTNKTILDPNHDYSSFYEIKDDKPIIKGKEKYIKNYQNSLKEFFQFDEEIFKNSMKDNASKVEVGIRFHKNFNEGDQKLNNELGYNIIRVDFKIVDFNDKSVKELDKFTWKSMWKPEQLNSGFAKSVKEVIKSTQPKDKIIHTLFIKFIKG